MGKADLQWWEEAEARSERKWVGVGESPSWHKAKHPTASLLKSCPRFLAVLSPKRHNHSKRQGTSERKWDSWNPHKANSSGTLWHSFLQELILHFLDSFSGAWTIHITVFSPFGKCIWVWPHHWADEVRSVEEKGLRSHELVREARACGLDQRWARWAED